jgi:hypothetical protein
MKIWYLLLVGLSLIVACGNPPPTVTLTASELNPEFGSSVTFTASAAPSGQIAKLELLDGTTILTTVVDKATLEQSIIMNVANKRSFTARVTSTAGVSVTSAVIEVNTKSPVITVSLAASELNTALNSSVIFRATAILAGPAKLELLEEEVVLKTVNNAATLEHSVPMDVAGKRSFTARVTSTAGVSVTSAVVEVNTIQATIPVVSLSATPDKIFLGSFSTLKAIVTSSSGIKEVEFFEGSVSLGKDLNAPFELEITDFTTAAPRTFKAVATDNNGLKSEAAITPITVLESVPTSFQLLLGENRVITTGGVAATVLSPDVTELVAHYALGTISTETKWTLQDLNSNPAPVDGSVGTIVAIPGDPNGLRSDKVLYIPPVITDPTFSFELFIEARSVQDPTQIKAVRIAVRKKGTVTGFRVAQSPLEPVWNSSERHS